MPPSSSGATLRSEALLNRPYILLGGGSATFSSAAVAGAAVELLSLTKVGRLLCSRGCGDSRVKRAR